MQLIANPVRFSETPAVYRRPPPGLGANTQAVLAEKLALSAAEIAALSEAGVIR